LPRMDSTRGRIFWRSFSENVHCAPLLWLNPKRVDDHDDRVGMYFSTWLARLDEVNHVLTPRADMTLRYNRGLLKNLATGARILAHPVMEFLRKSSPTDSKQLMERFYRSQRDDYDSFREHFLGARATLMDVIPVKKGGNIWVDLGGGTARNLEYFSSDIIREHFKVIYIVDVSPSLLMVARDRIRRLKLEDIVRIVEGDITTSACIRELPIGNADLVTMSYSLSMIPDQYVAVMTAIKLLKPDGKGILAIADFFINSKGDSSRPGVQGVLRKAEQTFHRKWFAMDHVHLLSSNILETLESNMLRIWDCRFRRAIPFLPGFRPIHGVSLFATK